MPFALVGRWKRGVGAGAADSPFPAKARSLEAALAALGPEESVAKTEIASALKRVRKQEVASVRVDPDAKDVAAREGQSGRPSQQWWTSKGQRWTLSSQR